MTEKLPSNSNSNSLSTVRNSPPLAATSPSGRSDSPSGINTNTTVFDQYDDANRYPNSPYGRYGSSYSPYNRYGSRGGYGMYGGGGYGGGGYGGSYGGYGGGYGGGYNSGYGYGGYGGGYGPGNNQAPIRPVENTLGYLHHLTDDCGRFAGLLTANADALHGSFASLLGLLEICSVLYRECGFIISGFTLFRFINRFFGWILGETRSKSDNSFVSEFSAQRKRGFRWATVLALCAFVSLGVPFVGMIFKKFAQLMKDEEEKHRQYQLKQQQLLQQQQLQQQQLHQQHKQQPTQNLPVNRRYSGRYSVR